MNKISIFLLAMACAFGVMASAHPLDGSWSGKLSVGPQSLTLVFNVSDNGTRCTMDSPDQGAKGIEAQVIYCGEDSIDLKVMAIGASFSGKLRGDTLYGTFSQRRHIFPLKLTRGEQTLLRPQEPAKPYPYRCEDVTFANTADGITLAGTLTYPIGYDPSAAGTTPVVLMVSGSGLQNRDEEIMDHKPFLVIADYLARHGIASLRFDDRGYGSSTGADKVKDATTADFARDAEAGITYLRGLDRFGKVGVIGHSEGANIAFILGAHAEADFVVSLAAMGVKGDSLLTTQINRQLAMVGQAPLTTAQYRLNIKQHSTPWLDYFMDYDPANDICNTLCPVMALNGSLDTQVMAAVNLPALQARLADNPKNLVKEYPGLNHLFQHCQTGDVTEYRQIEETISPEVLADIVTWITSL